VTTLVLSRSIGSITAAGLTLGMFGLYSAGRVTDPKRAALLRPARFILLLATGLAIVISVRPETLPSNGGFQVSSTRQRIIFGTAGLDMFVSHPVIGVGWQRSSDPNLIADPALVQRLHNAYIQLLAEAGLFGLVAGVVVAVTVRRRIMDLLRRLRTEPAEHQMARWAMLSLVVILIWWNDNPLYGAQPETLLAATFLGILGSYSARRVVAPLEPAAALHS
jgi:O-antigen ligase